MVFHHVDSEKLYVWSLWDAFPHLPHLDTKDGLGTYPHGDSILLTNETIRPGRAIEDVRVQFGFIVDDKLQSGRLETNTSFLTYHGTIHQSQTFEFGKDHWSTISIPGPLSTAGPLNSILFTVLDGNQSGVLVITAIFYRIWRG